MVDQIQNTESRENVLSVGVYKGRGLSLTKGEGALVWDDNGRRYIDCTSGVGVANVGHANLQVAQAIYEQAKTLTTCAGVFSNEVRVQCMEKLISISPSSLDRVFLCNSGTESIEGALKFARQSTGRSHIVSAMRGFHGRTMGALSATYEKKYREPFSPLVPQFTHVPFNRVEYLDSEIDDNTAAVLLELVQGEGGVRLANREYIDVAAELCDRRGALLIVDEVQTGFCRTGKMFACEHFDVEPDILCLAKGIAGGVPMGAILVNDKIQTQVGAHGSTFGGNPLASAACLAAIKFMQQHNLADHALELGQYLADSLLTDKPNLVREVRHLGLIVGIELKSRATPYLQRLQENGVLALPAGPTVIRLLPPLVISRSQIDCVVSEFHKVLKSK